MLLSALPSAIFKSVIRSLLRYKKQLFIYGEWFKEGVF